MTAKEVTLNYLKDIKKDLENAITKSYENGSNTVILRTEHVVICDAIEIVEEVEGE